MSVCISSSTARPGRLPRAEGPENGAPEPPPRPRPPISRTISRLKGEYLDSADPVLSMDLKARERLGNFFREGTLLTRQTIRVFDHDFDEFAEGVVLPHGLYDLKRNRGYIHLGTSHDTSEFACDC